LHKQSTQKSSSQQLSTLRHATKDDEEKNVFWGPPLMCIGLEKWSKTARGGKPSTFFMRE